MVKDSRATLDAALEIIQGYVKSRERAQQHLIHLCVKHPELEDELTETMLELL